MTNQITAALYGGRWSHEYDGDIAGKKHQVSVNIESCVIMRQGKGIYVHFWERN